MVRASTEIIERARAAAATLLEAAAKDLVYEAPFFRISGTDRAISLFETAGAIESGKCCDELNGKLEATHDFKGRIPAYPAGAAVCELEIDPDTGLTRAVKYTAVNDFGTVINPLLVEGQIQGGVVQGLGQVLLEGAVYDSDGQLVTGSFMDYAMPRAHDAPMIEVTNRPVPTKTNPIGAKGCGEAGTSGGLPAVANAVIDALSGYGIRHLEMPMTPARIWQAIQDAKRKQSAL